jgi:hypothetical protein
VNTAEFEISFSSEHWMIFLFGPQFMQIRTKEETSAINQFKPAHTYAAPYHESEASISLHVIVSHIQHIATLRLADKTL